MEYVGPYVCLHLYQTKHNHALGEENTKLKLYKQTILETKLSDFAGLNVTNYHEKLFLALWSVHQANSLPITFGSQLLANHAGPTDPDFVGLVSSYTAKIHTLNITKGQFTEAMVQLPQPQMVYRNSITWEATHKNQG